jgi:beta-glucosidase
MTMMKNSPIVERLLSTMTLQEKIGQLQQTSYFSDVITGHELDTSETLQQIREGKIGSILSVYDVTILKELQRLAVEESRVGIPLFFAFDVIHGYRTAFPINLALAGSFDPDLIERVAKASAYEAAHAGMHLTFSPMVDIVRDPRWGRVMESNGEDPYLSGVLGASYVKGYQGTNLSHPGQLAACVKHFAGYGFSEAGRDYNTVDLSLRRLQTVVIPPFKAAIDAGVSMVMTGFNVVFDQPATANPFLLQDILREQLQFKGVVISDYSSTEEMIEHKVATDLKDVAYQSFNAGIDHEMGSTSFQSHLAELIHDGTVDETALNEAVARILSLKEEMGLFENPYRNLYEHHETYFLTDETKKLALEAAEKSIILLKNDHCLPLSPSSTMALIGPFADSQDVIGEWPALTRKEEVTTIYQACQNQGIHVDCFPTIGDVQGADLSAYDAVIVTLGEPGNEAGEGYSKVDISIKKEQLELFELVTSKHNNVIAVVFAGRPLVITTIDEAAQAVLYAYQPGTQTGPALMNLITGKTNPSAKCAMTFPSHQGQIPLYYNHYKTGRPLNPNDPMYRYRSHYIDQSNDPLYPFGHGLIYGQVSVDAMKLSATQLSNNEVLSVLITLSNPSSFVVTDVVQVYIEALSYSVARPVNELKRFNRVTLQPNQTSTIEMTLDVDDFRSYNRDMIWTAETRDYLVKVGLSSKTSLESIVRINDEKK